MINDRHAIILAREGTYKDQTKKTTLCNLSWHKFSYLLILLFVSVYPGDIRCYCDAPHCVTTGYMCKSEINACFTKVVDPLNTNSPIVHGCLGPIANAKDICSISITATATLTHAVALTLECCHYDMCNYKGLHDLAQARDSTGRDVALAELNC